MQLIHDRKRAKRYTYSQVPNDTLRDMPFGTLSAGMKNNFRTAFIWHLEKHGTKIADLVRETGVSRDVINKLKHREPSSTTAENALLIAAYYGKTVNEFMACQEADEISRTRALLDLLSPEEHRLLQSQIRGLVQGRETEE